ncbi:gamete and mating-type specific protein A [Tieghemostelium lacteum]|uniref:Gamete and mating-type specific protein A n=1 Tax=Tieghemostelium lacteum TaxID=361077 RepID=A0A152AA32_TIELA|nr:gamete and mating-type specific protein A [Tieghemostelium lacteum]|eukprot:KYR02927.1 gamete and mating-type specific protein A [Tieghemostelium lacteum]
MKNYIVIYVILVVIVNYCQGGFTDSQKQGIVDAHNEARKQAGVTHGPKPVSPLNLVKWDNKIESFVQDFVSKCKFSVPVGSNYGFALYRVNNDKFEPGPVVQSAFESAAPLFDWNTLNCKPGTCCFMYPSIIWNASTSVGCATSWCENFNFFVCGYNPQGGLIGVPPYTKAQIDSDWRINITTRTPSPTGSPRPTRTPTDSPTPATPTPTSKPMTSSPTIQPPVTPVPNQPTQAGDIDWRQKGYVTPIRNQGQCGSCWSFTTAAALESNYLIKNGNSLLSTLDLAEQHFVDCASNGCNGGNGNSALSALKSSGVMYEADYPYKAVTQSCPSVGSKSTFKWAGSLTVKNTKNDFITALQSGPFYASLYVDDGFQRYKTGVYQCSSSNTPNHAVTVIGYNSAEDSFLIKNSWGTWWGESGFMRIKPGTCNLFDQNGLRPTF